MSSGSRECYRLIIEVGWMFDNPGHDSSDVVDIDPGEFGLTGGKENSIAFGDIIAQHGGEVLHEIGGPYEGVGNIAVDDQAFDFMVRNAPV